MRLYSFLSPNSSNLFTIEPFEIVLISLVCFVTKNNVHDDWILNKFEILKNEKQINGSANPLTYIVFHRVG